MMENSLLNDRPLLKSENQKSTGCSGCNPLKCGKNKFLNGVSKVQLYKIVARVLISLLSLVLIAIFIRINNRNKSLEFSTMVLNEDTLKLFDSLGFPENSKSIVYSKLEEWGFDTKDIADEEVNENYKEGDDLTKYKYSVKTYKPILFSYHETEKNQLLEKNVLLYEFLKILKKKKITTFFDFLNNFVILQDLTCLPVNLKGIYINNKFFMPNNENQIILSDVNFKKTLINEAPFLYLTSHGGMTKNAIHNICKFSRDGYFLGSVLLPFEEDGKFFNSISLRGLLLHDQYIYVVDSYKKNSKIFQFSDSIPELGSRRQYITTLISQNETTNPLMIHPYGIQFHKDYFYVSAQNTSSLLRYKTETGTNGPSVKNLQKQNMSSLVVKLNSNEEIRGFDFDEFDKCYVANKQTGVQVYDENFNLIKTIPVFSPISIFYNNKNNHILVGSSKTHDIKEYDVHNFELIKSIKHPLLRHVAGISVLDDSIFVVSQKKNKLLEFSLSNGLLKNTVVDDLSDIGERVTLSQT